MRRPLALVAVACAFFAALLSPAAAQNRGVVRGAEMNGYGRLVFTFKDMPKATASVSSGVLVISFVEPVVVDLEKLPVELPNYIGVARRDPDGKGLRFALTRPLRPNLKEAGEKVFLDLLPENWNGQPPALPQDVVDELAARARAAEEALRNAERKRFVEEPRSMPVRVSATPFFTRLVFEMPVVVPVTHERKDNRYEIAFEASLKIDPVKIKAQMGDAAKSIENVVENGVSRVVITVPDKVETFGFREDDTFVLDLVPPEAKARRSPEASIDPAQIEARLNGKPEAKAAPKPEPKPEMAAAPAEKAAPPSQKTTAPQAQTPAPTLEAKPRAAAASLDPVKPTVSRDGDTVRIAFKFATRPPAAAFDRYGVSTILFETAQPVEAVEPPQMLRDIGGAWRFAVSGGARIMRLSFGEPKLVRIAPDGEGWVVTIGDRVAGASEPIALQRILDENGRTVVTGALQRAGRVHWIDDSDTSERIAVITAGAPLRSIAKPYRFAEFELPPTAQGVAVVAIADDLTVRGGVDDFTIERGDGLTVSPQIDRPVVMAQQGVPAPASTMIDRVQWREARSGVTRDRIRKFEQEISEASRGKRNAARLDFARFLFANGLLAETRAELENIVRDQPDAARDRMIAMLRFATAVRTGRYDDARKLIADESVRDDPEAVLWRGVMDARQRNWSRAAAEFNAAETALDSYPDDLQSAMRGLWGRVAVETRDFATAMTQLDNVEKLDRDAVRPNEIALLRARIDDGQGRAEEAKAGYDRVFASDDRQAAAEAGLRGALQALADKTATREDVIARLETVAATWRGADGFEADAMAALGRLYAEDGRWRDAFTMARRGSEAYPDNEKIRALNDEAASLFEEVFTNGKGETLDRVQAVALFYDFKELTPPGRQGDAIVRRLAERLVELDLLDSAAELLQHQIDRRLTGPYRSILAARLAVIYLMNRKPAAALNLLKTTRSPELPYNIKRARNLLEARALSDLSRTDLALEIAAAESGSDIDRLTADIQWQGRRWRDAGETYERILGDRWKDRAPLSDRERADVLRAGIAYSLGDEALSLDRLRGKYGPAMASSADARAFQVVTAPPSSRVKEFRDLARQMARADTLAEFLDEYRKRYPDIPPKAPLREKPAEPEAPRADAQKPEASKPEAAAKPPAEPAKPTEAEAKTEAASHG
ncbi:hypothetical protein [Terrarubrum flagellatum]|uniref:hypothetical protein n=1 Tax=Terrirubrum flagellatum TaxID=2895980 RepID=UPI003144E834